jgi:hypothetical protein
VRAHHWVSNQISAVVFDEDIVTAPQMVGSFVLCCHQKVVLVPLGPILTQEATLVAELKA